jgi:hypothetical protein
LLPLALPLSKAPPQRLRQRLLDRAGSRHHLATSTACGPMSTDEWWAASRSNRPTRAMWRC